MRPLNTAWTQNKQDPKAKTDFEALVRNSTLLLTRLQEIIEERERTHLNAGLSLEDYKDPNWALRQAVRNGSLRELKFFKELISF